MPAGNRCPLPVGTPAPAEEAEEATMAPNAIGTRTASRSRMPADMKDGSNETGRKRLRFCMARVRSTGRKQWRFCVARVRGTGWERLRLCRRRRRSRLWCATIVVCSGVRVCAHVPGACCVVPTTYVAPKTSLSMLQYSWICMWSCCSLPPTPVRRTPDGKLKTTTCDNLDLPAVRVPCYYRTATGDKQRLLTTTTHGY